MDSHLFESYKLICIDCPGTLVRLPIDPDIDIDKCRIEALHESFNPSFLVLIKVQSEEYLSAAARRRLQTWATAIQAGWA